MRQTSVTLVITGRHIARVAALFPDRARTIAGADQSSILQSRADIIREVNVEQEPTYWPKSWHSSLSTTPTGPARAHPKSPPLIFRWPPVLAWRGDATTSRVLAMLKSVPFRQVWPGGRPGSEGGVDHSAQSAYDSARSSSGDSTGTARLIAVDHRGSLVRPSA